MRESDTVAYEGAEDFLVRQAICVESPTPTKRCDSYRAKTDRVRPSDTPTAPEATPASGIPALGKQSAYHHSSLSQALVAF